MPHPGGEKVRTPPWVRQCYSVLPPHSQSIRLAPFPTDCSELCLCFVPSVRWNNRLALPLPHTASKNVLCCCYCVSHSFSCYKKKKSGPHEQVTGLRELLTSNLISPGPGADSELAQSGCWVSCNQELPPAFLCRVLIHQAPAVPNNALTKMIDWLLDGQSMPLSFIAST